MDRASGRRPSPDSCNRTGNESTASANLRTLALARNNFTDDDSKSKNILAWAGRVKELIGTYDHGRDAGMGQLTRATGYSNLLAACGVDSGDVITPKNDQTSSTRTTNYGANYNQAKPTTSPEVKQLVAEKQDASKLAVTSDENKTTEHYWPQSTATTMPRGEGQPCQVDRQEIRRASSSQGRVKPDLLDPSVKPVARRASQTEVKPPATRDSSRSPDARQQLRRNSVGEKLNSTTERTSKTGPDVRREVDRKESSESESVSQRLSDPDMRPGAKQQLRRSSVGEKLNSTTQRTSRTGPDVRREAERKESSESVSQRLSDADMRRRGESSGSDIRHDIQGPTNRREQTSPRRSRIPARTNDTDEPRHPRKQLTPRSSDETLPPPKAVSGLKQNDINDEARNKPVRDVSKGPASSSAMASRHSHENDTERSMPTRSNSHFIAENADNYRQRGMRITDPADVDPADVDPSDSDDEAEPEIDCYPQEETDVEAAKSRKPPPQRVSDRNVERNTERYQDQSRVPLQADADEQKSHESPTQRLSDVDLRRRAERDCYPQNARASRLADAEQAKNTELIRQRFSGRDLDRYKHEVRAPADLEEKNSDESLSQILSDLDLRGSMPPQYQQRDLPPSQRASSDISSTFDTQDLVNRRDHTSPVTIRRRLVSDSGGTSPRKEASHGKTALAAPAPTSRATKPRGSSTGPPSPRPILRKTSPQGRKEAAVVAEKKKKKNVASASNRPCHSPPPTKLRAKPAAVPPRRAVAATNAAVAANDNIDDNDADEVDNDVYLDDIPVTRRYTGRGLGKSPAVTDFSDDLGVVPGIIPRSTADKRCLAKSHKPDKTAPMTSVRSTPTSLTPRRIWQIAHPLLFCLQQVLIYLAYQAKHVLNELLCLPEVTEACRKLREASQRVMDDWALFIAVIFAVACVILVIELS